MAIPTDFKGPTPAAGTTASFKVFGSATVGIWALDIDGTLAASTFKVELAPNLAIIGAAAYTDAQIIAAVKEFLGRMGHSHTGSAGGGRVEATKQLAVVATVCT